MEKAKKRSIIGMMFWPYARIVPTHLFILFGAEFGSVSFVLFIILKTIADIFMHATEHR